jgi:hypothetical protein
VWWVWVVGGLAVWLVVGLLFGIVLGRGVRLADERSPGTGVSAPLTTADLPASLRAPAPSRRVGDSPRRGSVPLPTIGVVLVVLALALETSGYVTRLTGARGSVVDVLSMDAPFSLPRLFVAGLFAVAAVAAVAGAARNPGRRTWWLAVGLVAAGIASVKAGGTVHADGMAALDSAVGRPAAITLSVLVALAVVGVLFFFSRTDRRDRRRVLGSLAGYGIAAVGLSALSVLAPDSLTTAATFVEESGEALAGVAFLIAVLIGVAPRLVLPADWALRRADDAHSLEPAPQVVRPIGDPPR